jgi:toxin ParE1/3/4
VLARYKVVLMSEAIADLSGIRRYIQFEASEEIAEGYIDRIEAFCRGFDILPYRGAPRDDIRAGLRVAIFERRVTIAYRIADDKVIILRVLGPGRNVQDELSDLE